MTIDEMIAVLQAFKDGKTIQWRWRNSDAVWCDCNSIVPDWNFGRCDYRVKPEPRTFYAAEFDTGLVAYIRKDREEVAEFGRLASGCKQILELVEVLK